MSGRTPSIAAAAAELSELEQLGPGAWMCRRLVRDPGSALWLYVPDETRHVVDNALSAAAGLADTVEVEARETWCSVVDQALTQFASTLSRASGADLAPETSHGLPPEEGVLAWTVAIRLDGHTAVRLGVGLSRSLCVKTVGAVQNSVGGSHSDIPPKVSVAGFERVLEVELPVVVSFGRTYMPLRDVLKLTAGSTIELDRLVNEPVEVVVNNCVIARGEVVVIDGHYGILITSIVDRNDRLALRHPGRPLPPYEEFRVSCRT
jgi:flagellar motor switch protein FliN/FliY